MRLPACLLLAVAILPFLRTADLPQPDESIRREHVSRNLSKLISNSTILNEELENATLEINGFLIGRNVSSAHRTIEVVSGYITHREEFIKQIHDLKPSFPRLANSSFFDEVKWMKELNRTKSELSKLKRVTKLYQTFLQLQETNEKVNTLTQQLEGEVKVRHLASALNLTGELVTGIESTIHEVTDVWNFTLTHNLTKVITNLWIEQLLDVQRWKYFLRSKTEDLLVLEKWKISTEINQYIRPPVVYIISVIGLALNGEIIIIFVLYPKIRRYRNMIILNLSIADTLSLIVNLPLRHLYQSKTSWEASPATAQIFMFFRFLCFGLSVFSVIGLCLQRFSTTLKLSVHRAFIFLQSTKHNCIRLIAVIWISAIVFAVPHGLYGCIYFDTCFNTNVELHSKIATALSLINLISLSITPTIAMTTLYWFTARRLNLRAQQFPVDMPEYHRTYQRKVLSRSKSIIILTAIVFAVTSLPYYVYKAEACLERTDINSLPYTIVEAIVYCLIFVNSIFNPTALYFVSGRFRHYINMHFFWWKRKENNDTKGQPTQTVLCNTVEKAMPTRMDTCL